LVIQSLAIGQSGQTMILDMGQPVNIFDLAEQMIHLAGFTPGHDIPIQITGLRPGEKLHESLVGSQEVVIPTKHPKIMALSSQIPSATVLSEAIITLSEATRSNLPVNELWGFAQDWVSRLSYDSKNYESITE